MQWTQAHSSAFRITCLYAGTAGLWISTSDSLLTLFSSDHNVITMFQTIKGWGFVLVTTTLLYVLLHNEFRTRENIASELFRVNRALKTLSVCNHALVRASDEQTLLHTICTHIVESGGYHLAWVGIAEQSEAQRVVPVAQAGYENGYLDSIYISWGDNEYGRGPTGTAIRTRQIGIARNIMQDQTYAPWRKDALQRGYKSSLALPLISDDGVPQGLSVLGALNIYAQEADAFDESEIALLKELADDLVYGIVALRIRHEHRQMEEELRYQKSLIETDHERLQMLSRRLVEIQETERRHIARELHDEVGQSLTGLHLLLEMINPLALPEGVKQKLHDAHQLVNDLIRQVREMSLNLRPAMLDDLGLLPTLQWFFQRYTTQTGIEVILKHQGIQQRLPPEVETVVYRIIQEALTNVARHAKVNEVFVRLWGEPSTLSLQIEDHGKGFDVEQVLASNSSSGLAGMQERVILLGGYFTIDSSPESGTVVDIEIPLNDA